MATEYLRTDEACGGAFGRRLRLALPPANLVVSKGLVVSTQPNNGPIVFVERVPNIENEIELLMGW